MGMILSGIGGLASLVSVIMIVIKIFGDKEEGGVGKGIFGLLCGFYAWYWAFKFNDKHNTKMFALIGIGGFVLNLVGQGLSGAGM